MIYICVPTYNEARTVGVLLWKIRQVMAEFPRDYQVLLADDGSTDSTPEVLAPYTRVLPLTVYRHEERHGYAPSTEMLLREVVRRSDYPRRDIIVTLQADFTDEPAEIPSLVRRIEGGSDVVVGALNLSSDQAPRSIRWTHKLLGYMVRRGRWPEELTDPLSGFRAYRVVTVKRALDDREGRALLESDGWAANIELLRAVVPHARRLDEVMVPVRYDRRFRETRFRHWETVRGVLAMLRLAPSVGGGNGAQAPSSIENDWEELQTGGAMAEAVERARERSARRRGGRRRSGSARSDRNQVERSEAGGRGDAERGERKGSDSSEGGEAQARRSPRRRRPEGGSGGPGGGEGRRRGGPRRRPRRSGGAAEGGGGGGGGGSQDQSGRDQSRSEGGDQRETTGSTPGPEGAGGRPRRRRRPRRRPSGASQRGRGSGGAGEGPKSEGAGSSGDSTGSGRERSGGGEGRGGGEARGGGEGRGGGEARRRPSGNRRGRRRNGRRTGASNSGTPGEVAPPGRAADG